MSNVPATRPDYSAHMAPRHRRDAAGITYADGTLVFDPSSDAACTCRVSGWHTCPRHNANTYAEQQARHSIDSIMPLQRGLW
jgi:hypothetical protein